MIKKNKSTENLPNYKNKIKSMTKAAATDSKTVCKKYTRVSIVFLTDCLKKYRHYYFTQCHKTNNNKSITVFIHNHLFCTYLNAIF